MTKTVELEVRVSHEKTVHGNVKTFKSIVDTLAEFIPMATLNCTPEGGFQVDSVDRSGVSIVAFRWKPQLFTSFTCPGAVELGVNFEDMAKVLRTARPDEDVTMRKYEGESAMHFIFGAEENKNMIIMNLIDMDFESVSMEMPTAKDHTVMTMKSHLLTDVIHAYQSLAAELSIRVQKTGVTFSIVSHDCTSGLFYPNAEKSAEDTVQIKFKMDIKNTFPLKYLSTFIKGTTISDEVKLFMKEGPLTLFCPINAKEDDGHLAFFLSPKDEEDMMM